MSKPHACVVIFAKSQRLGAVKTRLVPPLTSLEALELHRACLLGTLRVVLSLPGRITKIIYWSGRAGRGLPKNCRRRVEFRRQRGADLGARLANAIAELLERGYGPVVIVGSDHPTLPHARFLQALRKLARADVVLGPSLDGGYYLVGCRRSVPEMFARVPWGTAHVFRVTLSRLRRLGIRVTVLPPWYDVDRPGDLRRVRRELVRRRHSSTYAHELKNLLERLEGSLRQSSRRPQPDRQNKRRQPDLG